MKIKRNIEEIVKFSTVARLVLRFQHWYNQEEPLLAYIGKNTINKSTNMKTRVSYWLNIDLHTSIKNHFNHDANGYV